MAMLKGESGKSYEFLLGTNAWCRAEAFTGQNYNDILTLLSNRPSAVLLRQFLRALIVSSPQMDDEAAGNAIDDLGGLDVVMAQLNISLLNRDGVSG